jgi:hypothetical protein
MELTMTQLIAAIAENPSLLEKATYREQTVSGSYTRNYGTVSGLSVISRIIDASRDTKMSVAADGEKIVITFHTTQFGDSVTEFIPVNRVEK